MERPRKRLRAAAPSLTVLLPHMEEVWVVQCTELRKISGRKVKNVKQLSKSLARLCGEDADHGMLMSVLNEELEEEERQEFFETTLPGIAQVALSSERLFREAPLTYLVPDKAASVHLSREQVTSLLALSFFDLIPVAAPEVLEMDMPERLSFEQWLCAWGECEKVRA